jgi:hypothetical protein
MAKKTIAEASAELFKLLEPFDSAERARMVNGTLMLLGDAQLPAAAPSQHNHQPPGVPPVVPGGAIVFTAARKFFADKAPQGVVESLATAARFFESSGGSAALTKEDFAAVFEGARRNFSAPNFARDIDNAVRGGYFRGGGSAKRGYTLSHHGQDYVDALPNRETAKAIERPKATGPGKPKKKKATKPGA